MENCSQSDLTPYWTILHSYERKDIFFFRMSVLSQGQRMWPWICGCVLIRLAYTAFQHIDHIASQKQYTIERGNKMSYRRKTGLYDMVFIRNSPITNLHSMPCLILHIWHFATLVNLFTNLFYRLGCQTLFTPCMWTTINFNILISLCKHIAG